jgi:hypothetical protein
MSHPKILIVIHKPRKFFDIFAMLPESTNSIGSSSWGHRVVAAEWDEAHCIWKLSIEDLTSGNIFDDWCHFMISASGTLK